MSKFEILHKCVRHKTTDLKFCIRFVRGWSTKRRIFCAVFWICSIIADNCFIIITRESLPSIPYSYKEIYKIKTSGKYHSLERIYMDYDTITEMDKMVTEDEDSGLEYYQALYGDKVTTSHGNSNLSKYGAQNTLLIGDGCAIGAYIQDLILTGSALYLPESFEWKLLKNGMFAKCEKVKELIATPCSIC